MAKERQRLGVLAKTETTPQPGQPGPDLEAGIVRPVGVGLRDGEIAALDTIARDVGIELSGDPDRPDAVSRNSLCREAIRRFIKAYYAGNTNAAELASLWEKPEQPRAKYRPR